MFEKPTSVSIASLESAKYDFFHNPRLPEDYIDTSIEYSLGTYGLP